MRKKPDSDFSPPAVGGVSLLVAFAVLCLTVFALLSLSTVRADARLSEASAQAVADYYAADCEAQKILAQLRAGAFPDGITVTDGVASYSCPISDTQTLHVEVRLNGGEYTVLRWQAAAPEEWDADYGLDLWDGAVF